MDAAMATSVPGIFAGGNVVEAYGVAEMTNFIRMVTGLVCVAGIRCPFPVKMRAAMPKGLIADVVNLLVNTTVLPPKRIGGLIVSDAGGIGANVVATANCAI